MMDNEPDFGYRNSLCMFQDTPIGSGLSDPTGGYLSGVDGTFERPAGSGVDDNVDQKDQS
jgi:hypothetical protein